MYVMQNAVCPPKANFTHLQSTGVTHTTTSISHRNSKRGRSIGSLPLLIVVYASGFWHGRNSNWRYGDPPFSTDSSSLSDGVSGSNIDCQEFCLKTFHKKDNNQHPGIRNYKPTVSIYPFEHTPHQSLPPLLDPIDVYNPFHRYLDLFMDRGKESVQFPELPLLNTWYVHPIFVLFCSTLCLCHFYHRTYSCLYVVHNCCHHHPALWYPSLVRNKPFSLSLSLSLPIIYVHTYLL